ncbi:hypothetical protein MPS_1303 [Mycobacterium pseudoshottsii JCM 15466]|nr:hypothetical protein MPS_1303 [Mycobacterium pseudoshottsii JCM 15466]
MGSDHTGTTTDGAAGNLGRSAATTGLSAATTRGGRRGRRRLVQPRLFIDGKVAGHEVTTVVGAIDIPVNIIVAGRRIPVEPPSRIERLARAPVVGGGRRWR